MRNNTYIHNDFRRRLNVLMDGTDVSKTDIVE